MIERTDPAAVTTALALTAASPLLGDFSVIAVAAVAGAFVSASRLRDSSKVKTALVIVRSVLITTFSAGIVAKFLDSGIWGIRLEHSVEALAFVAFWMAVIGDGWFKVKDKLLARWLNADSR